MKYQFQDAFKKSEKLYLIKSFIYSICQKFIGIIVWYNQRRFYVNSQTIYDFPRLSYGFSTIPKNIETVSGGLVKTQLLHERYPNNPASANILYLISSALPFHATILAKEATRAGIKIVLNQNGVGYPAWLPNGWQKHNDRLSEVLSLADYVFYQSRFAKISADRFLIARDKNYEILYNAVDTRRYKPANQKRNDSLPVLLLAGYHSEYYRVETALKILSLVKRRWDNARLVLAGVLRWGRESNQMLKDIHEECQALNLDEKALEIKGPYSQEDAVGLYHQADILIHTQSNDVCPSVVIEAMACGLPVVYSDSGGTKELVGEDGGIGIPNASDWDKIFPPDPEAMANAVGTVLQRKEFFIEAARKRAVRFFGVDKWLIRHKDVFNKLLEEEQNNPLKSV